MPAGSKDWVIRIPRSDNANEFVLVYIAPSGKTALDLKFIATEGENPYVGSLRQSRLKDIRAKNFQGTDQELEQILKSVLRIQIDTSQLGPKQDSEIEATALIKAKDEVNELVINVRKKIDSITQRVATLTLSQNDDQTIELFEWMGLMLSRTDVYEHQISTLTTQLQAAEKSIKDLKTSLDDLVQSKREHENMLLGSFAQVLNEKKLKIRNQQRLLASANVDSEKARELESTMDQEEEEEAPKSRRNKRKAPARQQDNEPSDSDDEFEKMDIDKPTPSRRGVAAAKAQAEEEEEEEGVEEDERPETPQPLEEETESEAEEERMASPPDEQPQKSSRPNLTRAADPPPPPRRDLPFLRRGKGADTAKRETEKVRKPDETGEATGGETDDDEL
ncbi:hypothetical protein TMatcc_001858 [Talaromyces marneffei ATCC 18224]|uniref:Mitotic apparatus protein p62 n=2 Tax=Talaromyces marneffei TaxID=37727 RepID=B6QHZ5_TALMQ|nr:uncharacterized protein EYB26_006950 [Talaromyces marneffei]EEA22990.1 conserved hypothetical protein [Talaromyces marneffei ATCC 18224]QGA19262.1 hypothetical protein EYB26_006950 [Talaromyces marneffei]